MTTGAETPPSKDEQTASLTGGLLFGALFVAAIAVLTYVVIVIWPTKGSATGGTFHLFWGWTWDLDGDQQMLVLVTLAGALGGFVNSLQNLSKYVGEGRLKWRYCLSYLVQPIGGSAIALVLYIVILAGFANVNQVSQANAYGYLALALLSGLFVDQAMGKLRAVSAALFTEPARPLNPPGGGGGAAVVAAAPAAAAAAAPSPVAPSAAAPPFAGKAIPDQPIPGQPTTGQPIPGQPIPGPTPQGEGGAPTDPRSIIWGAL